jgi:hypothetical protein
MNITVNVAGIGSAPTETLIANLVTNAVAHTVDTATATRQTTGPDPTTAEPPVVASITF